VGAASGAYIQLYKLLDSKFYATLGYRVISEVASNNETAIERSKGKIAWARLLTGQAADLLCTDETESLDDTRAGISQLLLRDGVHSCRTFDRLKTEQLWQGSPKKHSLVRGSQSVPPYPLGTLSVK